VLGNLRPAAQLHCRRLRLYLTVARFQRNARLLFPVGRSLALLAVNWAIATRRRLYLGAALSALLVGAGGNAIVKRVERLPPPSFAEANQQSALAAANAAPVAEAAVTNPPPSAALASPKEEVPVLALTVPLAPANASPQNSVAVAAPSPAVPAAAAMAAAPGAPTETHASRAKSARIARTMRPHTESGQLKSASGASDPIAVRLRGKHSVPGAPASRQD
jgi:hypothetical protein